MMTTSPPRIGSAANKPTPASGEARSSIRGSSQGCAGMIQSGGRSIRSPLLLLLLVPAPPPDSGALHPNPGLIRLWLALLLAHLRGRSPPAARHAHHHQEYDEPRRGVWRASD